MAPGACDALVFNIRHFSFGFCRLMPSRVLTIRATGYRLFTEIRHNPENVK
jgi:hypothetical protein